MNNLFTAELDAKYGGGLAVIVASNPKEAAELLRTHSSYTWTQPKRLRGATPNKTCPKGILAINCYVE